MIDKLHIGAGKNYLPDWINLDIFSDNKVDLYSSAMTIPYPRASFRLIYASHVLEHFNRNMTYAVLTHWRDLLIHNGILRLAVPDFKAICRYYQSTGELEQVLGLMYGGQKIQIDTHHIIFDREYLIKCLKVVGFQTIREWDWRKTEHSKYDDYSQAYLPHMDKDEGILMSLNIEAVK